MKPPISILSALFSGIGILAGHASLVAHYKFDETSGTTAVDELGNSNATIEGTVGFVAGVDGGAFSFDGSTANNVTVADAAFLVSGSNPAAGPGAGLGGNFTISAWLSFSDTSTNVGATITLVDQDGSSNSYADISRIGNGAFGGGLDGNLIGRTRIGNTILQNTTADPFGDGSFHHVAFVVDSANSLQEIYVDGLLQSSVMGTPTLAAFSDLTFGHLDRPSGQTDVDAFTGLIDDVQIYDEALNSSQISYLANNAGLAVPEPSSLALAGFGAVALMRRKRRTVE